ncbi:DUF881 domain-containing protein [Nocardioides sp. W3-2-3]|nr:DUF881 domain-containing protein [Nocardioides convexus]
MLDTIQGLRTVGAEAIAINGTARVVAQTSFENTDGGFLVGGERVEAPYVIDAIGEPDVLRGAIDFTLGPKRQIKSDGGDVKVEEPAHGRHRGGRETRRASLRPARPGAVAFSP